MTTLARYTWVAGCVGFAIVVAMITGCDTGSGDDDDDDDSSQDSADDDAGADDDGGWSDDDAAYDDDGSYDDDAGDWTDDDWDDDAGDDDDDDDDDDFQPGQLTAGEWRDLDHWDFWEGLFDQDGTDWSYLEDRWELFTRQRIAVVVTDGGDPVIDASVSLKSGDTTIWLARTDNRGRAELFASLFDQQKSGGYTVVVQTGSDSVTIPDVSPNGGVPLEVEVGASAPPNVLDLMFVVDTTGSMGDELEYLKAELEDVIDEVRNEQQSVSIRLSVNFYRDVDDVYVVRSFPFTTNIDDAIDHLRDQSADGGGDYEEAVEVALGDAVFDHDWSGHARSRLCFLVLDAPPHHTSANVGEIQETVEAFAETGVRLVPVAASGTDKDTEFLTRFMDIATGGTYVFLTDDSGIGNPHLDPTVGEYQVELLRDLLKRLILESVE